MDSSSGMPLSAHGFTALCPCSCYTHLSGGETEAGSSVRVPLAEPHLLGPGWQQPMYPHVPQALGSSWLDRVLLRFDEALSILHRR